MFEESCEKKPHLKSTRCKTISIQSHNCRQELINLNLIT